jgi:SPP1 gp7 family putative phage head morphogenesis protein
MNLFAKFDDAIAFARRVIWPREAFVEIPNSFGSRFAEYKRRVAKPKTVAPAPLAHRATQEAVDTQADLDKMFLAAMGEQARYFRELHGAYLATALRSFEKGQRDVYEPNYNHAIRFAHIERVANLLAATRLLGRVRVLKEIGLPLELVRIDFSEVLEQVGVNQAVAYLASLPVATRDQRNRLLQAARQAAFAAAGVENTAALEALKKLVAQALKENWTRPEFEERAEELLGKFESKAGQLRTLWNTTTASAMAKGREDAFKSPAVRKIVPYWLYEAVLDDRVRPNHAALDGAIAPMDWERWWGPRGLRSPNGFNCRCTMVGLFASDREKLLAKGAPYFDATKGVEYGGPDIGFVKFAEPGAARVCCQPDEGWEKTA